MILMQDSEQLTFHLGLGYEKSFATIVFHIFLMEMVQERKMFSFFFHNTCFLCFLIFFLFNCHHYFFKQNCTLLNFFF